MRSNKRFGESAGDDISSEDTTIVVRFVVYKFTARRRFAQGEALFVLVSWSWECKGCCWSVVTLRTLTSNGISRRFHGRGDLRSSGHGGPPMHLNARVFVRFGELNFDRCS